MLSYLNTPGQKQYAKPLPNGDLQWAPEEFNYSPGDSVRYIDFEGGDDSSDGLTKETPWKHHPWDGNAEGNAASCSGSHTFVFKKDLDI